MGLNHQARAHTSNCQEKQLLPPVPIFGVKIEPFSSGTQSQPIAIESASTKQLKSNVCEFQSAIKYSAIQLKLQAQAPLTAHGIEFKTDQPPQKGKRLLIQAGSIMKRQRNKMRLPFRPRKDGESEGLDKIDLMTKTKKKPKKKSKFACSETRSWPRSMPLTSNPLSNLPNPMSLTPFFMTFPVQCSCHLTRDSSVKFDASGI